MNADLRLADERFEVIQAAEAWHGAGAIDAAALAAIRSRYADDRKRTKRGFRVLFFLFTIWGGLAVWGFCAAFVQVPFFSSTNAVPHATLLAFLAAGAAFGAWRAIERMRLRRFGIEEGLLALALGWELGAFGLFLGEAGVHDRWLGIALFWNLAVVATVLAGRWGISGTGALAGVGFFGAFALLPYPRLLWIVLSLPLIFLARWIDTQTIAAVAHRRRAHELYVVALVALYAAVHVSASAGMLVDEAFRPAPGAASGELTDIWRVLGWLAMIAIPVLLLVCGMHKRDRLDLSLGFVGLLATCATAVDALDLEPAWLVLSVAGAVFLTIALALRAIFGERPGRVAAGFTDAALYEPADGRSFLELAGTLAALTPAPSAQEEAGFQGQGGEFGGGGATEKF